MKKLLFFFIAVLALQLNGFSQYWQQQVDYTIDVTLNDKDHTLDGFEKMIYQNNSPDTLRFICIHLWPNAYKNDKTAFTDQQLENGSTAFYFANSDKRGYINRLDFKVNNITAELQDHPQYIDVAKLILPAPLAPGAKITITTPFHVKMPFNFSRGGHDGESYQATQWYPKPAVYDALGWHPVPYLDQGEFYSEFGSFDVSITVPKNYVVAATGVLQDADEKAWLKTRSAFEWTPVVTKEKIKSGGTKTTTQEFPVSSGEMKTLRYKQDLIHDFAWFADKRFIVNYDTCRLTSGKVIDVYSFYTSEKKEVWGNAVEYSKSAIRHYSALVGEYPYQVVSSVEGPKAYGGGMEYPTITIIAPVIFAKQLDGILAHEIGHNWFYGILASNERMYPWLDEGVNSYYEDRYTNVHEEGITQKELLETLMMEKLDQPIATPSTNFSEINYAMIAYYKTSQWLKWVERELGTAVFDKAMQAYYERWKFKHPQPADLKKALEETSGKNLDSAFSLLAKKGPLPGWQRKGSALQGPYGVAHQKNNNRNSVITILPSLGFNSYDKLMLGVHITNLKLPPNRLRFLFTPMYAFGSKDLTGVGVMNYSFFPAGAFRKIDVGVNAARFSTDQYTDDDGNKTFLTLNKIAPGIKLVFREKNPRSNMYRFIHFKSFFLHEQDLRFYRDSIFSPTDTVVVNRYRKIPANTVINQLKLVIENNRVLYPYKGELKIEQGTDFVRSAFTGNYFFNYPSTGGFNVRLFAGKFFYTSSKTINKQFATTRYHLNMTGANGYEDYTYSDYFIGRNKFEGFASQQIMLRDGGFKVRTDLLADKVGRTDDWLIAANFTTTIPQNINLLSVLPVKIPLRIFVDIGTQADAWKNGADADRFLYDAGLELSLARDLVHVYLPLFYSRVFRDYIQSTVEKKGRLWKTVSFTIDISNFSLRKLDRNLSF